MSKNIKIIAPFELQGNYPLDSRLVVQNLSDLPDYLVYDGMIVYQRSNKKFYKREDSDFKSLSEAAGLSSFNDATGPIYVVGGAGISIDEISSGTFEINIAGVILTDGSVQMDQAYVPQNPKDVATKDFVDQHAGTVATVNVLGHVKIDDDTIRQNLQQRIYVNNINGGDF